MRVKLGGVCYSRFTSILLFYLSLAHKNIMASRLLFLQKSFSFVKVKTSRFYFLTSQRFRIIFSSNIWITLTKINQTILHEGDSKSCQKLRFSQSDQQFFCSESIPLKNNFHEEKHLVHRLICSR